MRDARLSPAFTKGSMGSRSRFATTILSPEAIMHVIKREDESSDPEQITKVVILYRKILAKGT